MGDFTAAICEDMEQSLKFIHLHLNKIFSSREFSISFDCYSSGTDLLDSIVNNKKKYDVLFLDIDMPNLNGIELCKRLRLKNCNALIIFISNKEELVFQTFEVQPFRFIRKSYFSEELPGLADDIIREFKQQKGAIIKINELHSDCIYSLNINNIIYIEVIRKHCHIVTTTNALSIQYKITDFEELLKPYGFLQPHRSFLVNYRYIFRIDHESILLDNQETIPLSRKRIEHIKNQFITLTNGGI